MYEKAILMSAYAKATGECVPVLGYLPKTTGRTIVSSPMTHATKLGRSEIECVIWYHPYLYLSEHSDCSAFLEIQAMADFYFLDSSAVPDIVDKDGVWFWDFKFVCRRVSEQLVTIEKAQAAREAASKAAKIRR
jgi:hypothetical protein